MKNIDNFVKAFPGKSCESAFHGKKISTGFGKSLGEVDLFGI